VEVEPLVGGATPDDDGMAFTTTVVDVVGRSNEAMIARDIIIVAVTIMLCRLSSFANIHLISL
jgi:hypothetical protein